jgi:ubiquinone biosynthesis protein
LRIKLFQLLQGVVTRSVDLVVLGLKALSTDIPSEREVPYLRLRKPVSRLMASPEYASVNLLERVFRLVDCAARNAVVISSDLLLFRKALFTLEGILVELDPEFDIDEAMASYIRTAFMGTLPPRLRHWLSPVADASERLANRLSKQDLQQVLLGYALSGMKAGLSKVLALRHFIRCPDPEGCIEGAGDLISSSI